MYLIGMYICNTNAHRHTQRKLVPLLANLIHFEKKIAQYLEIIVHLFLSKSSRVSLLAPLQDLFLQKKS